MLKGVRSSSLAIQNLEDLSTLSKKTMESKGIVQVSTSNVSELYAQCNKNYQLRHIMDMVPPYLASGQTVLDLGCGTGELCSYAIEHVGSEGVVLGVDPDGDRIRVAQENYGHIRNVTFLTCKGSEVPISGLESKFDLACSSMVFHWMDHEEKLLSLQKVYQLLKPGGIFLLQFLSGLPAEFVELAAFIGDEEVNKVEKMFPFIAKEDMAKLCQDTGFCVDSVSSHSFTTIWKSLGDLCDLYTSSIHGTIDFRRAITKMEMEGKETCSLRLAREKEIRDTAHLDRYILQKP